MFRIDPVEGLFYAILPNLSFYFSTPDRRVGLHEAREFWESLTQDEKWHYVEIFLVDR